MPPVLAAIGALATAVSTASAATLFTFASIALTVGQTVFGAAQQKKAAKKAKRAAARAREDFLNSLQERTVTRIATEAPHVYAYGRTKVGSAIVAMFSSGPNDEYKHLVCVHAAGESESIDEVYINNKLLGPLDADGNVTSGDYYFASSTENITETFATSPFTLSHTPSSAIKVLGFINWSGQSTGDSLNYGVFNETAGTEVSFTRSGNTITASGTVTRTNVSGSKSFPASSYRVTYQYTNGNSQVRVKKHLGLPDDTADASLMEECPTKWAATAVLRGFTYTVLRLDLRQPEFQGGVPDINVLIKGRKLYDPRTGLTAWSANPALAIYDYLTSPMCGVDPEDIPLSHIITAANVCDEPVQGLC